MGRRLGVGVGLFDRGLKLSCRGLVLRGLVKVVFGLVFGLVVGFVAVGVYVLGMRLFVPGFLSVEAVIVIVRLRMTGLVVSMLSRGRTYIRLQRYRHYPLDSVQ